MVMCMLGFCLGFDLYFILIVYVLLMVLGFVDQVVGVQFVFFVGGFFLLLVVFVFVLVGQYWMGVGFVVDVDIVVFVQVVVGQFEYVDIVLDFFVGYG